MVKMVHLTLETEEVVVLVVVEPLAEKVDLVDLETIQVLEDIQVRT